ncbi:MAG: LysE family translocator [Rhodospirillales bacterium]|nr:LysE family translocator [Rhodospirillales bacterium]
MFFVDPSLLGGFIVTAVAIIMSPGPDTIVILGHALNGGRGPGLAAVTGVQAGLIIHTILAVAGISLIIASSPGLLKTVAVVGAAYLAWLGIKSFSKSGGLQLDNGATPTGAGSGRAFREAALCNLLNPKVILLFLALFPNFINPGLGHVPAQLITLSVILIVINVLWQAPMALAANAIRKWLSAPSVQRNVNHLSGAILLAMAGLMLYQQLL